MLMNMFATEDKHTSALLSDLSRKDVGWQEKNDPWELSMANFPRGLFALPFRHPTELETNF